MVVLQCCSAYCCGESQRRLREKYFYQRWLKISKACEPDEIKWENIGSSGRSRLTRKLIIWIVALAMIAAGILGLVYMKYKADALKEEFQTSIDCPESITKELAYVDQRKEPNRRVGLMHCYCLEQFKSSPTAALEILFTDIDEDDTTTYCYDWFVNYTAQNLIVVGTSLILILINWIICFIFERISTLEKHHTQNEETLG